MLRFLIKITLHAQIIPTWGLIRLIVVVVLKVVELIKLVHLVDVLHILRLKIYHTQNSITLLLKAQLPEPQ